MSDPTSGNEPNPQARSSRLAKTRAIAAWVFAAWVVLLNLLYLTIGDRTPLTEYLTIWPPVLWWVLLAIVAGPLVWRQQRWPAMAVGAAWVLFGATLMEWRPLLRWGAPDRPAGAVRVLTWNIGGGYSSKQQLLDEMARWQPDIVLLQETPDGSASFNDSDLTGYWQGFAWIDAGDCGVLSRWPMVERPGVSVGPWDDAQVVLVEGPWYRPLTVVNVRLMLPSLELLPLTPRAWRNLSETNAERIDQFPRLADAVRRLAIDEDTVGVVVGGDFNTDASARSIATGSQDVWPGVGRGWGATAISSLPVARIDQIHVTPSQDVRPLDARVESSPLSDHRPLWVDLVVAP